MGGELLELAKIFGPVTALALFMVGLFLSNKIMLTSVHKEIVAERDKRIEKAEAGEDLWQTFVLHNLMPMTNTAVSVAEKMAAVRGIK